VHPVHCDGGKSRGSLATLNAVIEEITENIVSGLPDYAGAEWFL
jgi:hypothetical protein